MSLGTPSTSTKQMYNLCLAALFLGLNIAASSVSIPVPGGHFYLVHRPMRLPELITTLCSKGLEPKRMRLVYPHADQAPNMVLLDCVRGGAPELRVEPPLIVYEKDGSYTPELLHIYYE